MSDISSGQTGADVMSGEEPRLIPVLRSLRAMLPPGPAAAARFVIEHPTEALPMTMQRLAVESGTSDASVLRMARAAGCKGYREFRTQLAASLAARPRDRGDLTGIFFRDDPAHVIIEKLAAQERQAIADTAAAIHSDELIAAATAIVAARRILVIGIGASGLVACDLSAKLERIGLVSAPIVEGHAALTSAVMLQPEDVVVAISASGETFDIVEPLQAAIERGATTIAITAHHRTSLDAADHTFVVVAADDQAMRPTAMSSRTGQSLVVDALFILVLQRMPDAALKAISVTHEALRVRRDPSRARSRDVAVAGHPCRPPTGQPEPDAEVIQRRYPGETGQSATAERFRNPKNDR